MRRGITALVLGLVLAAAGCGDDGAGGAEKVLTKADLVRQSAAVCLDANRRLESAGRSFFTTPGAKPPTEARFVTEKVIPIYRRYVLGKLRTLTPPQGDEKRYAAIIAAGETALDKLRRDPDLIKAPAESSKNPFRAFGQLAKAYGLLGCGA